MTGSAIEDGKRVLLIVGGGIAAYKSLELVRLLVARGITVQSVLTDAGAHFVTPLSLQALSQNKVHADLFSLTLESEMGHIALSRWADLIVVCPATANLLARMANGLADDLATTLLLATDTPMLVAPAMNVRMWEHPATRTNMQTLQARGIDVIGPDEGLMACSEFGAGRLSDPACIADRISERLAPQSRPLTGRRMLVTAGPTHEPIDPVRYIANRSSGQQGYAIAQALAEFGADVTVVTGPVDLPAPVNVNVIRVETAHEMLAACESALPVDVAICAAAVADWRVAEIADLKIKKSADAAPPSLTLIANPDILASLSEDGPVRPALVIGFAAETNDVIAHASDKRRRKGCDWIVANDVSAGTNNMGGTHNEIALITPSGVEQWPRMAKSAVGRELAIRISRELGNHPE